MRTILSPEDDLKLDRQLRKIDDLYSNALLLLPATGMRIGESLGLKIDALRDLGHNEGAIKIPLGKLHTERWVPVDEDVCGIFRRILHLGSWVICKHSDRNSDNPLRKILKQRLGRIHDRTSSLSFPYGVLSIHSLFYLCVAAISVLR
jgi:integrase